MSMKQKLTMIVAASENDVIGSEGKMPWHIPADMKRFKELTVWHPVIMGRKTYESIPERFRPLKNRRNIVMSRTMEKDFGFYVARDLSEALAFAGGSNSYIMGGGEIYEQFYDKINEIELTRIHKNFEGDAFLPKIDWKEWRLVNNKTNTENLELPFSFQTYERI